jgi:hypothetical protein
MSYSSVLNLAAYDFGEFWHAGLIEIACEPHTVTPDFLRTQNMKMFAIGIALGAIHWDENTFLYRCIRHDGFLSVMGSFAFATVLLMQSRFELGSASGSRYPKAGTDTRLRSCKSLAAVPPQGPLLFPGNREYREQ